MSLPPLAPWQQRAYTQACAAIADGHWGHATLITGPDYIGKRLLAEHLARRVLCLASVGQPCGTCRSCALFERRAQTFDVERGVEMPELRPDGRLAHPWGRSAHPDLLCVSYEYQPKTNKLRTEIVIEQVRALTASLGLTAQLGGSQVVILDPADAVNWSAWNAILKTLEEPQPGRYLWLLASSPARVPATIRSRCQRLEIRLPPRQEALDWLQQCGHAPDLAAEALEAARGHPGLADAWIRDGGLTLRHDVADAVQALQQGRRLPMDVAQAWCADGRAEARLQALAELALRQASSGRIDDIGRLGRCFDAANQARALLRTTVRAELAVLEALLPWQQAVRAR
jgi:DNA polymerase-3 subunit delta'